MSRPPSRTVIEAVELAEREHPKGFVGDPCSCGYEGPLWHWQHVRAEVARAAEAAALKVAAERMDDLSRGAPLAAAITARTAAIRLDHWADELTDTDDRSE